MVFVLPTDREVAELDNYQKDFCREIATPIKNIYLSGNLTSKTLSERVGGVSEQTWSGYGQPSYTHSRSLHLIAILSWLTGVGMSGVYVGNKMSRMYREFSASLVRVSVLANQMIPSDFYNYIDRVLVGVSIPAKQRYSLQCMLNELDLSHPSLVAPSHIDSEVFADSYYRSVAKTLRDFRAVIGANQRDMARYLGVSRERYVNFENGSTASVPLECAVRLKFAFKLGNTVQFVSEMNEYSGFVECRNIHQQVENILVGILSCATRLQKRKMVEMAECLVGYTKSAAVLRGVGRG